jgi:hypothetical protein
MKDIVRCRRGRDKPCAGFGLLTEEHNASSLVTLCYCTVKCGHFRRGGDDEGRRASTVSLGVSPRMGILFLRSKYIVQKSVEMISGFEVSQPTRLFA